MQAATRGTNQAMDDDYGWLADGIMEATREGAKWADLKWRPPDECELRPDEQAQHVAELSANVFYAAVLHRDVPRWRVAYRRAFLSAFNSRWDAHARERRYVIE